ncbi:hypothetical protein [Streptomyces sp. YS-3]|uniref:hypothetical protein n=1 Tax=Streptomyces sp. YS-3 TaxID=3381352 RepID=UPI0038623637
MTTPTALPAAHVKVWGSTGIIPLATLVSAPSTLLTPRSVWAAIVRVAAKGGMR